jgi:hypothetical protein
MHQMRPCHQTTIDPSLSKPRSRQRSRQCATNFGRIRNHMEAKAEGWADTPTVGVEYVPWTAEEPATKADPNQLRKIASCVVTPGTIRRNRGSDPKVQRIKNQVRNLRKEGLDYKSICDRLGDSDRPRRAAWRHLSWPIAYKRHTSAVTKWLSEACRDLPSVTI